MMDRTISSIHGDVVHKLFPAAEVRGRQYRSETRKVKVKETTEHTTPKRKALQEVENIEGSKRRRGASNGASNGASKRSCCMFGGTCGCPASKTIQSIPKTPKYDATTSDKVYNREEKKYARKMFRRKESLRRAGIPNSKLKDPRICDCHEWVTEVFSYSYNFRENGKVIKKSATELFKVPSNAGRKVAATTMSHGLGVERYQTQVLQQVEPNSFEFAMQQCMEITGSPTKTKNTGSIKGSPTLLKATRLDTLPEFQPQQTKEREVKKQPKNSRPTSPPSVLPNISDELMNDRTGFKSTAMMLSFVMLVCDGNVEKMMERDHFLTWFEEWLLFFQWQWGRESPTLERLARHFNTGRFVAKQIIVKKSKVLKRTMGKWPRFLSLDEDRHFMSEKWRDKFKDQRTIFWDNTNVNVASSNDADVNRHTYSHYYGRNVAKGGVFVQSCGWLGTWELWAGKISDSDYQRRSGVFESLDEFSKQENKKTGVLLPFTSIVDKGYRCGVAAWRAGKQLIRQPVFARSDRKFNSSEVNLSADVAAERSGNERAVNVAKKPVLLNRGTENHRDPALVADTWLVWGFQANFMFKSVMG